MIRRAVADDLPALLAMGQLFSAYTAIPSEYSPQRVSDLLVNLLENGAVFVSESDGSIEGAIVGLMADLWYVNARAAAEMALWVMPDRRGAGVASALVEAFEDWGVEQGADYISMSDLRIEGGYPAGEMFDRMGYQVFERARIKGVR